MPNNYRTYNKCSLFIRSMMRIYPRHWTNILILLSLSTSDLYSKHALKLHLPMLPRSMNNLEAINILTSSNLKSQIILAMMILSHSELSKNGLMALRSILPLPMLITWSKKLHKPCLVFLSNTAIYQIWRDFYFTILTTL